MQVLEGSGRYDNIFKDNPPTEIYQYVERIQCWKGRAKPAGSSAQGYCWLVWDYERPPGRTYTALDTQEQRVLIC